MQRKKAPEESTYWAFVGSCQAQVFIQNPHKKLYFAFFSTNTILYTLYINFVPITVLLNFSLNNVLNWICGSPHRDIQYLTLNVNIRKATQCDVRK